MIVSNTHSNPSNPETARATADAHAWVARESAASGTMAKRWNQSAENSKREDDPTDTISIVSFFRGRGVWGKEEEK
tara:strand:+ start:57 stop:284 length:228 start_codon:yes stop_codon:yes gene_type:complete